MGKGVMGNVTRRLSAVIDRIVDGTTAVLLLEEENTQLLVPLERLPVRSKEGTWLQVLLKEDQFIEGELDLAKTEEIRQRIHSKRALLLERMARGRRTP